MLAPSLLITGPGVHGAMLRSDVPPTTLLRHFVSPHENAGNGDHHFRLDCEHHAIPTVD